MTRVACRSVGFLPWPPQGYSPPAAVRGAHARLRRDAGPRHGARLGETAGARPIRCGAPARSGTMHRRRASNGILPPPRAAGSTGRSPLRHFPHRISAEHPPIARRPTSGAAGTDRRRSSAPGGLASGTCRKAHRRLGWKIDGVSGIRDAERPARGSHVTHAATTGNVRNCTYTRRLQRMRSGAPVVRAQCRTIGSSTSRASCINGDVGRASGGAPYRARDLTARAPFGVQRDVAGSLKYRDTLLHPKNVSLSPTSEATFRATFRLQSGNNTSGTGS